MFEVTFCIPTYNGMRYLSDAVNSVLEQRLNDYEIIIVDDLSSDGTFELACELAGQNDHIRVYRNESNLGIVPNWNRCLELARGEWIKFIFQDDLLATDCTSRLLEAARKDKCRLAFCEREIRFEDGIDSVLWGEFKRGLIRFPEVSLGREYVTAEELSSFFINLLGINFLGEPTCALLHRSCIYRYGPFNPQLTQVCDLEYWVRIGIHEGVVLIPDSLATFRVHPSGASNASHLTYPKRFRRNILDPLILYSSFLFDPVFHPLRRRTEAIDAIRWAIWFALRIANEMLCSANCNSEELRVIRTDWETVLDKNPAIDILRSQLSLPNRIRRKLTGFLTSPWASKQSS
jgi:glycosyltransferase involved in cell wall biosynthesis